MGGAEVMIYVFQRWPTLKFGCSYNLNGLVYPLFWRREINLKYTTFKVHIFIHCDQTRSKMTLANAVYIRMMMISASHTSYRLP